MKEYLTHSGPHIVHDVQWWSDDEDSPSVHKIYKFPNGYGASVIDCGYGREEGLWELAVINHEYDIQYDTPITSNVLGWLTVEQVEETLVKIRDMDLSQIPFECPNASESVGGRCEECSWCDCNGLWSLEPDETWEVDYDNLRHSWGLKFTYRGKKWITLCLTRRRDWLNEHRTQE